MLHIKSACIVMISAMLLAVIMLYSSSISLINTNRAGAKIILNEFISENKEIVYKNISNKNDELKDFNSQYFTDKMKAKFNLTSDGNFLYRKDENQNTIYKLSIPTASYTITDKLNLIVKYDMYLPVYFSNKKFDDIKIHIETKAKLNFTE